MCARNLPRRQIFIISIISIIAIMHEQRRKAD
jgi:hypothetical protein